MKTGRELAGAAAWSAAARLLQFALGLVAIVVIAREVGPAAFGEFALSWVLVGLVEIVVASAPGDALVQRRDLRDGHRDAAFWGSLAAALIAWAAIAAAASPLAVVLGGGAALAAILPLRAAMLPLAAVATVPSSLLARAERFEALAAAEAVAGVASSAVGIGAALAGAGIWSLVAMELARQALLTAIVWRLARWTPGLRARREHAADLFGFSARTWVAWGTLYVETQLPRLLIGHAFGAQALGWYALAYRIYDQVGGVLLDTVYQISMAAAARRQADRASVAALAAQALRATTAVAAPVFLGMAAIAPILVPLVFGDAWSEAVPLVQLMMAMGVLVAQTTVQVALVRAMGRADWHVRTAAIGLALTAALCAVAVPFGVVAIGVALVVKALAVWPVNARCVASLTGLSGRAQAVASAGPVAAAVAMSAGTAALVGALQGTAPALALVGSIAAGAALYPVALALFARDLLGHAVAVAGTLRRGGRGALPHRA